MAISVTTTGSVNNSASPITYSRTISTGESLLVFVYSTTTVSSVTFASVPMVPYGSINETRGGRRTSVFFLATPTVGTNNLVVTLSSGNATIHTYQMTGAGGIGAIATEAAIDNANWDLTLITQKANSVFFQGIVYRTSVGMGQPSPSPSITLQTGFTVNSDCLSGYMSTTTVGTYSSNWYAYNSNYSDYATIAVEVIQPPATILTKFLSDPDIVAYYPFANGAFLNDVRNGYNLTNNNSVAQVSDAKFGYVADIGSTYHNDRFLYTPNDLGITGTPPLTIMGWVKMDTLPTTGQTFLTFGLSIDNKLSYFLGINNPAGSTGISGFRYRVGVGNEGWGNVAYAFSADTWYHLTVVYSTSGTPTYKAYINAVEVASVNTNTTNDGGGGWSYFVLGNDYAISAGQGGWDGKYAQVGVILRALTQTEINSYYTFSTSQIKQLSGLNYANVKSFAGTPKANIKSINGLQ